MNNYMNLIKISEFAKLCNVSKQTLIYYDKIDIFKPAYVDEKGYRYYSLPQYDSFSVISMLRELNTSLKEIKQYINNKNINFFLDLLDKKKEEAKKNIENLNKLLELIEVRKKMTQNGIKVKDTEKVFVDTMDEENIIISDYVNCNDHIGVINIISTLEDYINKNNNKLFYIGTMIEKNKLLNDKYPNDIKFYAKTNKKYKNETVKPKGLYAITFHKGSYETIHLSYNKLIDYIKKNNYKIVGNEYENTLLDFFTQKNEKEYLTRICIQVEK